MSNALGWVDTQDGCILGQWAEKCVMEWFVQSYIGIMDTALGEVKFESALQ